MTSQQYRARSSADGGLVRSVATALRRRCGLREGDRVLAAISGGADSVALLRALATLAPRRRWRLTLAVGHVQHHLRGEAAEADARWVEALAERLDLPFVRADVTVESAAGGGNVEAEARRKRYAALAEMAAALEAPFVATAHHGDDQLETLLMRLLRGASVAGLRGIAWKRPIAPGESIAVVRPMLNVTRQDVLDFLRTIDQQWREDHTNADVTRTRARLRQDVLPVLRDLQPDVASKTGRLAEQLRYVHRLLEREIAVHHERVLHEHDAWVLDRVEARDLNPLVLSGLLRRLLGEAGVSTDRLGERQLRALVRAVRDSRGGERRFEFEAGVTARVTASQIQIRQ